MLLESPVVYLLGQDPDRVHRINANSFQQNAITTANGWQYATFYTDRIDGKKQDCCYVNISRRKLGLTSTSGEVWETLTFLDYRQTHDDGHNTISIGICEEDGTIHVSFDHHCDQISKPGLTQNPEEHVWAASLFSETLNSLPGLLESKEMSETTYPRFVNIEHGLLLTYRVGQAGSGSDILYRYSPVTHEYSRLGQYLTGISSNPYTNGIDSRLSRIHVSWCNRNFVPFTASLGAHKQHAGPNGPENNCNLNYAYSDDAGVTWKSSEGQIMAKLESAEDEGVPKTINSAAEGVRIFEIPMGSGILNQEAQCADWVGGFWAVNREKIGGRQSWMVYYRDPKGKWSRTPVTRTSQPTETGARASVCVDRRGRVYLILPGNFDGSLEIKQASSENGLKFETVWKCEDGFDGEPLVDVQRLEVSDILSVFTRTTKDENGRSNVVVLDFDLSKFAEA